MVETAWPLGAFSPHPVAKMIEAMHFRMRRSGSPVLSDTGILFVCSRATLLKDFYVCVLRPTIQADGSLAQVTYSKTHKCCAPPKNPETDTDSPPPAPILRSVLVRICGDTWHKNITNEPVRSSAFRTSTPGAYQR